MILLYFVSALSLVFNLVIGTNYYAYWRASPPIAAPIWGYGHYSRIRDTHNHHYWHPRGYEDRFKPPLYDFPFNAKTNEPDYSDEPCEQDKKPWNPSQNGYHPFHPFNGNWPSPATSKPPTQQQTSPTTDEDTGLKQQQGTPVGDGGRRMPPPLIMTDASGSINIQNPYVRPSFQNTTYLQKCGEVFRQIPLLKSRHTPILNGRPANPKEFPHMALLGYGAANNIQWACGGSLISDQYVLTAAHCIFAGQTGYVRYIRLGELDLNNSTEDADVQDYGVRAVIRHPLYSPRARYHDIALIQLNATVSFSSYIRPICLATTRELDGKLIVAAGWGLTQAGGDRATILQRATFKNFPFERCRTLYGTPRNLPNGLMEDIHICADGVNGIRDACKGDSGGPMQYTNYEYNEENLIGFIEIVGVTSFGEGACGTTPGVYTRVLPYVGWIERIVWPNDVL